LARRCKNTRIAPASRRSSTRRFDNRFRALRSSSDRVFTYRRLPITAESKVPPAVCSFIRACSPLLTREAARSPPI
jgi:hypothetical protein